MKSNGLVTNFDDDGKGDLGELRKASSKNKVETHQDSFMTSIGKPSGNFDIIIKKRTSEWVSGVIEGSWGQ